MTTCAIGRRLGARAGRRALKYGLLRLALAPAVALACSGQTFAQNYRARYARVEEPQLFKCQLNRLQGGVFVEEDSSSTSFNDGSVIRYERSFIAPSLWWGLSGSIYHPKFLQYDISGDGAYGWGRERIDTDPANEIREMQRYGHLTGTATILAGKPFNGVIYGNYGRSFREYDFFTRSTVESSGYGTRWSYRKNSLDLVSLYSHVDETTIDTAIPYSSQQDTVSLDARKTRLHGASSMNYTMNQIHYSSALNGAQVTDHSVTLTDGGELGSSALVTYGIGANASHHASDTEPVNQVAANANLSATHYNGLTSSYDANYNRVMTDGFVSEIMSGSAAINHQLYQSLASSLSLSGSESRSGDTNSNGETHQYGVAWTENYSKRLGSMHRLQLDHFLSVQHVDQGGGDRAVNERHSFPAPPLTESFLLSLPDIIETSIVVKDAQGFRTYLRGFDYDVFPAGSRVEIRRVQGGSIPEGSVVLVDYRAAPGAQGAYETMTETFGGRLYLWRNLWQVYGRIIRTRNNASDNLHAQEVLSRIAGSEFSWRALQAGLVYEDYETRDTVYHSTRLSESYYFSPDDASSVTFAMTQAFLDHVDTGRAEQDYRFTVRYRRAFTARLQISAEGGVDRRTGDDDQTLQVFRTELQYSIGLTHLQATYDLENNDYLNREERSKNRFTLTLKRDF